ncbi:MAG: 4-hydroxy-3-methylbut-2-enyl diphosphate reductase [Lachnospiraceae bacterium]|nr:4-hydroxy-3-methylbut-2-enyl diphosphate reductase [Lachnospiraceae bacterium]
MEVILAESAGFCFGVKRAVDTVYEKIEKGGIIYTYGPIIHNKEVVNDFLNKGVKEVNSLEELDDLPKGCVIVRSHGVAKDIYEGIEKRGFTIIDTTCPFVKRIQKLVNVQSKAGKTIVIIGNDGHPEVEGIKGWCENKAYVVGSKSDILELKNVIKDDVYVVSQTTFNINKFKDFVEVLKNICYDKNVSVANTICNATNERQNEAAQLAEKADVMIVIGDSQSSNSRKLYEISKTHCERTYFIQTLKELHLDLPANANLVGITAGASTPKNIIEEVQKYVRTYF